MCVCIQCFWEWLVQHLRKKPIIRYEQVPFDIDDHIEEEFVQETTRLLTPESDGEYDNDDDDNDDNNDNDDDDKSSNEEKVSHIVHVDEVSIELTSQSQMTISPYVTAESTDSDTDSSSEEKTEACENTCLTND